MNEGNCNEDDLTLAKAESIIRKGIFDHKGFSFDGNFPKSCQQGAIPASLKALVGMIMVGPSSKYSNYDSQACLTASQVILYNTKKRQSYSEFSRHNLDREPPLPVYIGLGVHASTKSRNLIEKLCQLGSSIPYDIVMDLQKRLASYVCKQYEQDGVVAPPSLQKNLFTVGAFDNLDHNPSSTTSITSFHGTAISLFQSPTV